ncbi:hypothetical protein [Undibacterium crateris]|uniref:hypothetical protein n=1 Tax=Undibacterium crateris TaxID=2528175 RepID=UPI00138A3201|nr:hypothetical protein [Undibacterium crateris]NDI85097.1 hypothetical protein [Undibacterium crateris]
MSEIPSAYREVIRTARKEHKCCECRGVIQRGEKYHFHSGIWDGETHSFKVCADCTELRQMVIDDCQLCPDESPGFSCLGDDLEEWHLERFKEIQIKRLSLKGDAT